MNISTISRSLIALLFVASIANAQPKLIHYWHFNNTPTGVHLGALSADYSTLGNAYVAFIPLAGVVSDTGYTDNVSPGDTVNARLGAAAGFGIRTRNPSDSMQFLWVIPTTHYKNIVLTWESQSSSVASGPHFENFDYSLDNGATFQTTGLTTLQDSAWLAWHGPVSVSLAAITGANDNSHLVFRIRLSAPNTGGSGNNRYDNITVEGDTIASTGGGPTAPTTPSIALFARATNSWTHDSVITVTWFKSTSATSTVAGYSYAWDHSAAGTPDTIVDGTDTSATLHVGQGRNWYFHTRAIDATGTGSTALTVGPINIDTAAPSAPHVDFSSHVQGTWSNATSDSIHWAIASSDTAGLNNLKGYALVWSQVATTVPDTLVNATADHAVHAPLVDGEWYAHLRVVDSANNWSATTHYGPIKIDQKPPTVSVSITGHAVASASPLIPLVITAADSGSGVEWMQISNDGTVYSVITPFATAVAAWDIRSNGGNNKAGIKHVWVKVLDSAGNISQASEDSIRYAPTGVKELDVLPSSTSLTVFPNPVSSICTIQFNEFEGQPSSLQLFDALGRNVFSAGNDGVRSSSARVDLSGLPAGIYVARLSSIGVVRTATITVVK